MLEDKWKEYIQNIIIKLYIIEINTGILGSS